MTLTRVTVVENESNGEGGGVWTHSERLQTIVDSTFTHNKAGVPVVEDDGMLSDDVAGGGGLHTDGGPVTCDSTFDSNEATEEGGGPQPQQPRRRRDLRQRSGTTARTTAVAWRTAPARSRSGESRSRATGQGAAADLQHVERGVPPPRLHHQGEQRRHRRWPRERTRPVHHRRGSLFLNNTARIGFTEDGEIDENAGKGGGIMSFADGDSLIENTTISGNQAATAGGGLFHDADGELRLLHITVWRNSAPAGGGIGVVESDFVPEIPPKTNAAVILKNSIVGGSIQGGSCDWYVRSEGGNLETGDKNTCFLAVTAETAQSPIELGVRDRRGDPQLQAIADNGGPTLTHALRYGSLAIDSSAKPCSIVDQRGTLGPRTGAATRAHTSSSATAAADDDQPPETVQLPGVTGRSRTARDDGVRFRGTDDQTAAGRAELRVPVPRDRPDRATRAGRAVGTPARVHVERVRQPVVVPLLEEGRYRFEVRAIDRADNIDPTPVSTIIDGDDDAARHDDRRGARPDAWYDGSARPTTIPTRTAARRSSASRRLSEFTPRSSLEYECRLDSRDPEAWVECFNPTMFSDLTTGLHTFEVRALPASCFEGRPDAGPLHVAGRARPRRPGRDPDQLRRGEHHPDPER